jgi:hypothetical protein
MTWDTESAPPAGRRPSPSPGQAATVTLEAQGPPAGPRQSDDRDAIRVPLPRQACENVDLQVRFGVTPPASAASSTTRSLRP